MFALDWRQSTAQSGSGIPFATSGRGCIAEDLAATAQSTVCGVQRPSVLDSAQCGQQLRGGNFGDRPAANPRKNVAIEETEDSVTMVRGPSLGVLSEPFPRHGFKTINTTVGLY